MNPKTPKKNSYLSAVGRPLDFFGFPAEEGVDAAGGTHHALTSLSEKASWAGAAAGGGENVFFGLVSRLLGRKKEGKKKKLVFLEGEKKMVKKKTLVCVLGAKKRAFFVGEGHDGKKQLFFFFFFFFRKWVKCGVFLGENDKFVWCKHAQKPLLKVFLGEESFWWKNAKAA